MQFRGTISDQVEWCIRLKACFLSERRSPQSFGNLSRAWRKLSSRLQENHISFCRGGNDATKLKNMTSFENQATIGEDCFLYNVNASQMSCRLFSKWRSFLAPQDSWSIYWCIHLALLATPTWHLRSHVSLFPSLKILLHIKAEDVILKALCKPHYFTGHSGKAYGLYRDAFDKRSQTVCEVVG